MVEEKGDGREETSERQSHPCKKQNRKDTRVGHAASSKGTGTDPLEPSWGEPELLMSLAWSSLNRAAPDVNAADQYAHAALA